MARIRISRPARQDLASILETSLSRWGEASRQQYARLLGAAMRTIARSPRGATTRDRADLASGVRSFHIRHARGASSVKAPVHVVFYRINEGLVEIIRVLHERMEPAL